MRENFATANTCPSCGSIDVNVMTWGMPTPWFGRYMSAYHELSHLLTMRAFPDAPGADDLFGGDVDRRWEFLEWFNPEEGRGIWAPGNNYDNGGCIVTEDSFRDNCSCRSCGNRWSEHTDDWDGGDWVDDDEGAVDLEEELS